MRPKKDGSGKGKRGNKGRGGCKTPRSKGRGKKWNLFLKHATRKHAKVDAISQPTWKYIGRMVKTTWCHFAIGATCARNTIT